MNDYVVISIVIVFIVTYLLTSRFFYTLELKSFSNKITRSLSLDILDLNFSFEQMVYLTSLPSNLPLVKDANRNNINIEYDFTSLFFPRVSGIKIFVRNDEEHLMVAYLPIKDFRLPTLDRLLKQGKLDETSYTKISTYKLMHKDTLKEIADEVFKQIKK